MGLPSSSCPFTFQLSCHSFRVYLPGGMLSILKVLSHQIQHDRVLKDQAITPHMGMRVACYVHLTCLTHPYNNLILLWGWSKLKHSFLPHPYLHYAELGQSLLLQVTPFTMKDIKPKGQSFWFRSVCFVLFNLFASSLYPPDRLLQISRLHPY